MKQIILEEPGKLSLQLDIPEPTEPPPGNVLVKTHRVGICGTDLHAFRGVQPFFEYPRVLGHELAVEVLALGPGVEEVSVGDYCSVEPYVSCGECFPCRNGKTNCCAHLSVLGVHSDGGMREYFNLPAKLLLPSSSLSLDQLALVEMLGIGAHAVERAEVSEQDYVLLIGAGPIGMGAMQFAQAKGARLIAMDINAERLEFCKKELGVEHTLLAEENVAEVLSDLTKGDGPSVVIDATGFKGSMEASFGLAAPGARICFVGHTKNEISFANPVFHKKELSLLASRNATRKTLLHVMACIEAKEVDTTPWITHRSTMESLPQEFESYLSPQTGVIKAMLELGS